MPTQEEVTEALQDFTNETNDSVSDLIDAIYDHMAPNAQRRLQKTRERLMRAQADFNQTMT